jgi:hypothetical protein
MGMYFSLHCAGHIYINSVVGIETRVPIWDGMVFVSVFIFQGRTKDSF